MKHERNVAPQKWRLSRTLKRRVDVRPIEPDDLKYVWAAYKKGGLASMGEEFASPEMSNSEFDAAFEKMADRCAEGWIVQAETRRGFMPIGLVLGGLAPMGAYLIICGIVWFPWASKRNIIEGAVSFFNSLRKQAPWMLYATDEHKRLYEVGCMHGIMRRVGTSMVVIPGRSAAVFEGRA